MEKPHFSKKEKKFHQKIFGLGALGSPATFLTKF
jgi:hypothetical protein